MKRPSSERFNLNGTLFNTLPALHAQFGRAYMYGDGIFESIRMFSNTVPLWNYHYSRLTKSLSRLSISLPEGFGTDELLTEIHKTASGNARLRLTIWRNTGGLYLPERADSHFMVSASPSPDSSFPVYENGLSAGLSEKIQVPVDYYSGIKSLSAQRYVNAAIEARDRGLDDVILLNSLGSVCESSNSSIFWTEKHQYFTIPDYCGQVHGVFQQFLRETMHKSGISVTEKPCTFASLLQADEILLTNAVTGIRWVRQIDGKLKTGTSARWLTGLVNRELSL